MVAETWPSPHAVVGSLTTGSKPQDACAADIARLLEECVIHISNEPEIVSPTGLPLHGPTPYDDVRSL